MHLEPLDVEEILLAPSSTLVGEQVLMGKHGRSLVGEGGMDALGPGVFEHDAVNGSDYVDPDGLDTNLEDEARRRKIFKGQIMQRSAKVRERADDALGVGRICANPEVEVLRCP